jgi:hypothetical protein
MRIVMAGLDPAIHVFSHTRGRQDVDARDKRGHDGALGVTKFTRLPVILAALIVLRRLAL